MTFLMIQMQKLRIKQKILMPDKHSAQGRKENGVFRCGTKI